QLRQSWPVEDVMRASFPASACLGTLILASLSGCASSSATGGTSGTGGMGGTGGQTMSDPAHLDPPPAGQGFQFGTPDFQVPSGTEEQDCYFFKVSDLAQAGGLDPTKPVNLHRVQVAQRVGSHHMNIFRVKTIVNLGPAGGAVQKGQNGMGQCFVSSNWA